MSEMTKEQKFARMQAHIDYLESDQGKADHLASQRSYFAKVKDTYIEAWPRELCSLSIAQVDIPLTLDEASSVGRRIAEFGDAFVDNGPVDGIERRVDAAIGQFPNGAFIRLGSRSPKDSWLAQREGSMKVCHSSVHSPLRFIFDCSERMYEDLSLAIQNEYPPHIFVRQWIDLKPWQEFRCFMRDRQLIGISQYQYFDGVMPEIVENHESIQWAITTWFEQHFRDACHLSDVVFDVFVTMREQGHVREWGVRLLEINPFFAMTDPCLFSWNNNGADFDCTFRFHGS